MLAGLLLPTALVAVGIWNPWNLTYLDMEFTTPLAGVIVLAAVGLLWHLCARGRWRRAAGFAGLLLCLLAGAGVMVLSADLDEPLHEEHVVNADNDVEAALTSNYDAWTVQLRADRGLLSRAHRIARIGRGDSVPPTVEARFVNADELVITADGEEVYRVRFDPGDLDVEEETCRPYRGPQGTRPGCVS